MTLPRKTEAVFFDLDGTLLDTAPDLAFALNSALKKHQYNPVAFEEFRYHIYGGSKTMLKLGFQMDDSHVNYKNIQAEFLKIYADNLTAQTQFFNGMERVLNFLDEEKIPWGVITNKPAWLTDPLLHHFGVSQRSCCVISGDTLKEKKPHPLPMLHACQLINVNPQNTVYVGDTEEDVIAAKAAGMQTIIALYGYRPKNTEPQQWNTDLLIEHPLEIIDWLK